MNRVPSFWYRMLPDRMCRSSQYIAIALRARLVEGSDPLLFADAVVLGSKVIHPLVETFRELKLVPYKGKLIPIGIVALTASSWLVKLISVPVVLMSMKLNAGPPGASESLQR